MTDENARIKYAHLKNIIAGKYSTERYDPKDDNEEINLDKVSNELMVSDAKRHLADLIKKRPKIDFEEPEIKDTKPIPTPRPRVEIKSKEKE